MQCMQLSLSWPAPASAKEKSWISSDFQKPDLLENNPSNTRNNMKSQIKNKKNWSFNL